MKGVVEKYTSYVVPLIVVISLFCLLFFLHRFNVLLDQKLTEFGYSASDGLMHSCELGVLSEDETFLEPPLRGVLAGDDVVAVAVYNANGRIIVSRKKVGLKESIPPDIVEKILRERTCLRRIGHTAEGDKIYDFYGPILASGVLIPLSEDEPQKVIGFTRVGLSLNRIHQQLATTFLVALLIGILMILLGFSGVLSLRRHRRAQIALRDSEEKYRSVIENAGEGIVVIQDDIIRFANPKMTGISGYSNDELTSTALRDLVHPDDRDTVLETGLHELRNAKSTQDSFRLIKRNGDIVWLETTGVEVMWEERPASLTFLTDISQRKRMEEELLKTQKLESVGILAGGIAHDFNNILTAILGSISLAKLGGTKGRDSREHLERAESAAARAQLLTQQLLTFSKGGSPLKKTTSISEVMQESTEFVLRGSKTSCTFRMVDDLWPVEVDVGQFSQVIHNLILNADQAMPNGGTIQICAENMSMATPKSLPLPPGRYVKISIRDQGMGIPEEHLQKVFDPYFTTKQKGSGLGLAISYSIISKHGGHITVDSTTSEGATFHIYLPASSKKIRPKAEEQRMLLLGKGRILFMDDEQLVREIGGEMLRHLGYDVELAKDGAEAIRLYSAAMEAGEAFDAVIMDLTIPGGMGGTEAIHRLREIDPDVKAVVSSGYFSGPVASAYMDHGFKGVVAKPYRIEELSEVLNALLAGNSSC